MTIVNRQARGREPRTPPKLRPPRPSNTGQSISPAGGRGTTPSAPLLKPQPWTATISPISSPHSVLHPSPLRDAGHIPIFISIESSSATRRNGRLQSRREQQAPYFTYISPTFLWLSSNLDCSTSLRIPASRLTFDAKIISVAVYDRRRRCSMAANAPGASISFGIRE